MPSGPGSIPDVERLHGVDVRALAARARALAGEALAVGDADVAGGAQPGPGQVEVAVVRVVARPALSAGARAQVHPGPAGAARDVHAHSLELDVLEHAQVRSLLVGDADPHVHR